MSSDFYTFTDGFIQVFKFNKSTDAAVEAWAAALENHIQQTPADQPVYVLLDVTGDEVTFSAAARQQSKRIFSTHRDRVGYIALLFEWRTSPYFARLFFASLGKLTFKMNYFHRTEAARAWLQAVYAA